MKKIFASMTTALVVLCGSHLGAASYNDATGELFNNSFTFLDIASVEVSNDATDLIFKINLVGDPVATDWGKYMIGINTGSGTADTAGNGWSRPISASYGFDYWVGSWADSGNGAELYKFIPSWTLTEATYNPPPNNDIAFSKNTSSVTITTLLSNLGLAPGNSFSFDVFTSGGGGGDSAVDALNNPNQSISDWPGPYNSGIVSPSSYTVVPEPSSFAILALLGAALGGYQFRRKS